MVYLASLPLNALNGEGVERAFSRLKGQRSLNCINVRGLRKVTAHCYLSVLAMQIVNLEKVISTPVSPQRQKNEGGGNCAPDDGGLPG